MTGHLLPGTTLRQRTADAVADERLRGNVARAVDRFAEHRVTFTGRHQFDIDDAPDGDPGHGGNITGRRDAIGTGRLRLEGGNRSHDAPVVVEAKVASVA